MKNNISAESESVSPKQAITDPKFRYLLLGLLAGMTLGTLNGAAQIAFYGQPILEKMLVDPSPWLSVNNIMNYLLIMSPIAQFSGMTAIQVFKRRRPLIITYAFVMAGLNFLLVFFDIISTNLGIMLAVCSMAFIGNSIGSPILGLFATEVSNSAIMGIGAVFSSLVMLIVGFVIPFMVLYIDIPYLFLIFGVLCTIHGIFNIIFIKETAFLTDKEKKTLYFPSKI